jgi:hypothetical protein
LGDCGIGLPGIVGICPVGIGRAPGIDPPIPPLAGIIPLWNPPVLVGIGLPGSVPGMFSIVPMPRHRFARHRDRIHARHRTPC